MIAPCRESDFFIMFFLLSLEIVTFSVFLFDKIDKLRDEIKKLEGRK